MPATKVLLEVFTLPVLLKAFEPLLPLKVFVFVTLLLSEVPLAPIMLLKVPFTPLVLTNVLVLLTLIEVLVPPAPLA